MTKTNIAPSAAKVTTHEGGRADAHQSPEQELLRAVSACLLWEDTFYESGADQAQRISDLVKAVKPDYAAGVAIRARKELYLRHAPLWVARAMAKHFRGKIVGDTIAQIVDRADELGEFLSLYWKDGRKPIAAQVKRGLALAFPKFDAYQLAKYNRDATVKLRDVLFMVHAKPKDEAQAEVWKKLVSNTLPTPDTWEVALSVGANKKDTFERLIAERRLGYLALLRNLRTMEEVGVDHAVVAQALQSGAEKNTRVLPFRFVAAARFAPSYADVLDEAMRVCVQKHERLSGTTILVVDVSGSMDAELSSRSTMNRIDAAGALAILLREIADRVRVVTFSNRGVEIPNLRGFGLLEAIHRSQPHQGTYLGVALDGLKKHIPSADRTIVVTDEQAHDGIIPAWTKYAYLINVASYKPALVTHGGWTRISGFSERIVDWMRMEEEFATAPGALVNLPEPS